MPTRGANDTHVNAHEPTRTQIHYTHDHLITHVILRTHVISVLMSRPPRGFTPTHDSQQRSSGTHAVSSLQEGRHPHGSRFCRDSSKDACVKAYLDKYHSLKQGIRESCLGPASVRESAKCTARNCKMYDRKKLPYILHFHGPKPGSKREICIFLTLIPSKPSSSIWHRASRCQSAFLP